MCLGGKFKTYCFIENPIITSDPSIGPSPLSEVKFIWTQKHGVKSTKSIKPTRFTILSHNKATPCRPCLMQPMIRCLPASPHPLALSPFVSVRTLASGIHQSNDSVQWYHKHTATLRRERKVRLLLTVWMITQSYQKPRSWGRQPWGRNIQYRHSLSWTSLFILYVSIISTRALTGVQNSRSTLTVDANEQEKHVLNFMLACKYIPAVHDRELWIFMCASQHLCLHLCIFVSHLCSRCYWTKASGSGSDKWCLALVWTAHQMRQRSRNHIRYSSPPCLPLFWLIPPIKQKWHRNSTENIHHLIYCAVLCIYTFSYFPLFWKRGLSGTLSVGHWIILSIHTLTQDIVAW